MPLTSEWKQMIFSDDNEIVSGGNFHGEYPGKAADYLAIAVHEIANMSVMRIERLLNGGMLTVIFFITPQCEQVMSILKYKTY